MATSTMIQFLDAGEGSDTSNRSQTETFFAGGAIIAGDWVQFDTSKTGADRVLYVVQDANTFALGNGLIAGVALNGASAGEQVRVVVAGYAAGANVANAVAAAGVPLVVDNTAAGRAVAYDAADTAPACGVSLAAAAGNKADVWVYKQF